MTAPPPDSRYLDYLPAIFRTPPDDGSRLVLGQFLRAFEEVMSGNGNPKQPGLSEIINGIAPAPSAPSPLAALHRYAEPGPGRDDSQRTPPEFLDWLAGWVALSLRADLDEETQRDFIAKAVSLYQWRGTPKGLADVLTVYTHLGVTIDEGGTGLQVGVTATVGEDTLLGGFVPHYFEVTLRRRDTAIQADELARYRRIATEIIEQEKPAHCFYNLKIISVTLQVGVTSRVGIDTLLASA